MSLLNKHRKKPEVFVFLQLSPFPSTLGLGLAAFAPKLSDEQISRGHESLLKIVENGGPGQSPAIETLLALPPYLDIETRKRIQKVLENNFRCDFVVYHFSTVEPMIDPPNGAALSQNVLRQLLNYDATSVAPYRAGHVGSPIYPIIMAVSDAKHVANMLAHPGAVGEMREALLKRFEELVHYGGQHIFITEKPKDEEFETPVNAELGALTPGRSPEHSPR